MADLSWMARNRCPLTHHRAATPWPWSLLDGWKRRRWTHADR